MCWNQWSTGFSLWVSLSQIYIFVMVMIYCSGIMCLCNQKHSPRGALIKVFRKYTENLQENTHAEVWLIETTFPQNVFSSKFASYFQNTFLQEHLKGLLLCYMEIPTKTVVQIPRHWKIYIYFSWRFPEQLLCYGLH